MDRLYSLIRPVPSQIYISQVSAHCLRSMSFSSYSGPIKIYATAQKQNNMHRITHVKRTEVPPVAATDCFKQYGNSNRLKISTTTHIGNIRPCVFFETKSQCFRLGNDYSFRED